MDEESSTRKSNPSPLPDNPVAGLSVSTPQRGDWSQVWDMLLRLGLGEPAMRLGTGLASVTLILLVLWIMSNYYLVGRISVNTVSGAESVSAAGLPSPTPTVETQPMDNTNTLFLDAGIYRLAQIHTNLPARPRFEVIEYTVVKGDTVFGIAEKFNLKPETILWGNYNTLVDDPHRLKPDQKLNILPVNGVYYEWHAGDGLNGVAKWFGVTPEDIINWQGNHLSLETVGDFVNPNIEAGTWLIIPNGMRGFVTWSAPRISRTDPAVAKILGPGACGQVMDGPVGNGTFVWPTTDRFISGYDYSPETNHNGIDIAGKEGNPIFASDNGVVVYAGWNDWGYGNVIVIDHGAGWQTLYAHLSALNVGCGSYVYQGGVIGYMGTTGNSSGPHLHFEMLSETFGKANPKNFLK